MLGLSAVLSGGCQNPYEEFFREDGFGAKSDRIHYRAEPARILRGSAPTRAAMDTDMAALWEEGYGLIGLSGFIGSAEGTGPEPARQQATKIGAAVALVYTSYMGNEPRTIPVVTNTFTTTHTRYGPVTSTGTGFSSVPVSVSSYDFTVIYYAKVKRSGVGILVVDLDTAQRQRLGANKGVVMRGSAAFEADILPGDILTAIEGQDIVDRKEITTIHDRFAGRSIRLSLWRDGKGLTKVVAIPSTPQ